MRRSERPVPVLVMVAGFLLVLAACGGQTDATADEQAIRARLAQWSRDWEAPH